MVVDKYNKALHLADMTLGGLMITRVFKLLAIFLVLGIVFVAIYSLWVVYSAREYTVSTVLPAARTGHFPLLPSQLTPQQMEVLLKVEDPNFFHHGGTDFATPGAGITTITQGVVKHFYFEKFEPGFAKLKQTLIAAYALDPLMSKEEQLALFINTVNLGHGIRGFEQASQMYFGKPFKQLTEDQYDALVAMIVAPAVFDLQKFPSRNAERVARIKRVVSGEYKPHGLLDLYYGKIDAEAQKNLSPFSYFASYYE